MYKLTYGDPPRVSPEVPFLIKAANEVSVSYGHVMVLQPVL